MRWTTFKQAEEQHGLNAGSLRVLLYAHRKKFKEMPVWAKKTDDSYHVYVDVDYILRVPVEAERLRKKCGEYVNRLIKHYGTGHAAAKALAEVTRWKQNTWASFMSSEIHRYAEWKERRTVVPVRLIEKHEALRLHAIALGLEAGE